MEIETIAEHHYKINRIADLEAEVEDLKLRLMKEVRNRSKIKCKYEELKKRYVPNYRGNKDFALELIAQLHEKKDITFKQIEAKTKLCNSTIRGYSSEYLKTLNRVVA